MYTDKPVSMEFAVKNMLILEVVVLSQDVKFIANYFFFNTCQINLFTKISQFRIILLCVSLHPFAYI